MSRPVRRGADGKVLRLVGVTRWPPTLLTSDAFTGLLKASEIQISMDGKGSWKDNVFVERLWKSVKYEEVYLRAYESVPEARTGLGRYFEFYNAGRPHSSLGGMTPDQFFDRAPAESAAA